MDANEVREEEVSRKHHDDNVEKGGEWLELAGHSVARDKKNSMKDGEYPEGLEERERINRFRIFLESMLKSANQIKYKLDRVNSTQARYDQGYAFGIELVKKNFDTQFKDYMDVEGF